MQSYFDVVRSTSCRLARRRPRVILLNEPWPVQWRIRRLTTEPKGWARGFPYFGDGAELLEAWGLYSRSVMLRHLRERVGLSLGDELCWMLRRETEALPMLSLADLSYGRLHSLRSRARVVP